MGDVAIAMHPDDERWPELQGKNVRRPLNPAEIPLITDEAIEKDFGTGMLVVAALHLVSLRALMRPVRRDCVVVGGAACPGPLSLPRGGSGAGCSQSKAWPSPHSRTI